MADRQDTSVLTLLPIELLAEICLYLPNSDIKSLRLTCKFLVASVSLRMERVFLSAHKPNIAVFLAIAEHETFRKQVVEIIWDDSTMTRPDPDLYSTGMEIPDVPVWYRAEYDANTEELEDRNDPDLPHLAEKMRLLDQQLSAEDSWDYFRVIAQEYHKNLDSTVDANALKYGLERFTALERVVITPAAHGVLFTPLYETPMIRNLPPGLNYPLDRGWPSWTKPEGHFWHNQWEAERHQWRGVCIVLAALAQSEQPISELIIDNNQLNTGLNIHIFDDPEDSDYQNLAKVVSRPQLRRLDLALSMRHNGGQLWRLLRNEHLRKMWTNPDLEHIKLGTDIEESIYRTIEQYVRLRDVFPVEKWPRLRHFGLSQILVTQRDLLSLLASLPATIRSVELSFLIFMQDEDDSGGYHGLLSDMRSRLRWRDRPADEQPKVAVKVYTSPRMAGRAIWLDKEIDQFLYGAGENPFQQDDEDEIVVPGYGLIRDEFDPDYRRTYEGVLFGSDDD